MAEGGKVTNQPKTQGHSLMVSDFIMEHFGYLKLTNEEYEHTVDPH